MSGSTPNSKCRHCSAERKNHIGVADDKLRCPGGSGTRFEPYSETEPQLIPLDAEEIAVLKIILSEAHRYGTLRASTPALKRLQARFAQLADKRIERVLKRGVHRL